MGAEGEFKTLKVDPAIERWALMRENVYQHFKFTPRTTRHVLVWGVFVPVGTYLLFRNQYNKHDWAGKLKGQSLLKNPPPSAPAAEA